MVFTKDDLQRVSLAAGPDLMWELVLSLQKAQVQRVPEPFLAWRHMIGQRLTGSEHRWRTMSLLRRLVQPVESFPDFLTPHQRVDDLDAACEALTCTSRARLQADLAAVFADRTPPAWARSLAQADREQVGDVVRAVRAGHDLLLAPWWSELRQALAAERARRAGTLATRGVGALLAGLPGVLGWDGEVLRTRYPEDRTVHLGGGGVVLVPSYFCWGNPITWMDPALPPVLVYQARQPSDPVPAGEQVPASLVALLGSTRAECLSVLRVTRSTSELAQRLSMSAGTASKQTAVLRDAGLITSVRRGGSVLHTTTSLGAALLAGRLFDY
jgi:DNA-binding transcriptional ArsR family regulator